MKTTKRILCLLLIMALNQLAHSQKARTKVDSTERESTISSDAPDEEKCPPCRTQQEITWDFQTGKITEPCCLQKGVNLPITIKNINTTLFDAKIESEFIDYHRQPFAIIDFGKKLEGVEEKLASTIADNPQTSVKFSPDDSSSSTAIEEIEQTNQEALASMLRSSRLLLKYGADLHNILQQDIGYATAKAKRAICIDNMEEQEFVETLYELQEDILEENSFIKNQPHTTPLLLKINEQREELLKELELSTTLQNIQMLYATIGNPKTFEVYTTLPIKDAYELSLTLKATPKDGVSFGERVKPLNYNIKGIKISFSPGIFVNHFPEATVIDKKDFQLDNMPTDSVFLESSFDKNSLTPSVGALIHVSFGGCKDIDGAISAGASTRLEAGDMRWHLGGSLLLGKQRRFVLSAGVTLGQSIQELNPRYQLGKPYPTADLVDKALTREVVQLGWFIGFSYNLPVTPKS